MVSIEDLNDTRNVLERIDKKYECIGCVAHGGFGSVFLAKTRNKGRHVALKVMPMNTRDDEEYKTFIREVEAVVKLNTDSDNQRSHDDRALSIIYFEDWLISHTFVSICMEYADGGTLAQEIKRRAVCNPVELYSERRIAWYALQLADALAFAHERGVAHHDVKPGNILIDASKGGKLLLADFGTSVKPGEECTGFTMSYAPPELLASYELDDFSHLRHDKTDAFALGCVLYELLMCDTLENSPKDGTLAHLIERNGLERVMEMPYMKLPWLLPAGNFDARVGYSDWLKQLVMSLLRPVVNDRFLPSPLVDPLRSEQSPLLQPNVVAANSTTAGASVTIDNVQLGMLVQRGQDWDDGDADGGAGCIGVITKLDHDALFTWVTFPLTLDSVCCRIGSNCKYELQVSAEISDYLTGTKNCIRNGIAVAHEQKAPGHMLNSNCMVIGNDISRGILFAAPLQRTLIPSLPSPGVWRTDKNVFASPIEDVSHPDSWNFNLGALAKVEQDEWDMVLSLFYGDDKPGKQLCETYQPVDRVQRVQNSWLWESYARRKGFIALENWGVHNELRVFVVCNEKLSADNLQNFQSSGKEFSTTASIMHDRFNNTLISGSQLQMIFCRVLFHE